MSKDVVLELVVWGIVFEVVNPELFKAEPDIGKVESCDWECLRLKTDTAKQDLTGMFGSHTQQKIVNMVIESFKQS